MGFGSLISASNVSVSIHSKCYLSRTKQPQGKADVQHLRIRPPPATGADGTESALSASCSSSPCGGEEARMQEPGAGSYTVEICYRGHEYVVLLLAPRSKRRLGRKPAKALVLSHAAVPQSKLKIVYKIYSSEPFGSVALAMHPPAIAQYPWSSRYSLALLSNKQYLVLLTIHGTDRCYATECSTYV